MRSRRAISQAGIALDPKPGNPAMSALARDTKFLGDVSDGSAVLDHARDKQTTTMQIQTSVSVGHEDLLGEW